MKEGILGLTPQETFGNLCGTISIHIIMLTALQSD